MKVLIILALAALAVCEKSPEEGNMFEGDMELNPDQMVALQEQMAKGKNQFASIRAGLWFTNGKPDINYYIDPILSENFSASSAIKAAIADYHKYTCLKFIKRNSKPSGPHIFFTTGSGCSSPVGRERYGNSIRLARGCWRKGTIMHEIGHSIGLFHEQSRPDRDRYVTIRYNEIIESAKYNFNKLSTSRIDSRGTPYDYDSMMHYGSKFFSANGRMTIQTKNPKDQNRIGQRGGFSEIDKKQINLMYCQRSNGFTTPSTCQDKNTNCKHWTKYCRTNSFVKENCKKTCSLC